ncbi:uncharacterized protein (TIGR03083 family) [Lipingzhangella halophila]|uniref:Uncharacterized protein (TIGR03083 family) n=1 Tax=Lipingzhangella halophila TaxID=1783352 RepID=A0A7W7RJQ3_9ACTN|nr:uncharacterized protein (TIGR03083 family) [Lipingzhangella halophila]
MTNIPAPMYASPEAREEEIRAGATLNPEALRNLVDHAAIDLDVRWRDLPADQWNTTVVTAQGRDVPVSENVWMRSREVWLHAVDLDSGARIQQVPAVILPRLLSDIHQAWVKRLGPEAPCLTAIDDGNRRQWGRPSGAATHVEGPDALVARTSLISRYRHFLFRDPQLPSELTPEPWPGDHSYTIFHEAHRALGPAARAYVSDIIDAETAQQA